MKEANTMTQPHPPSGGRDVSIENVAELYSNAIKITQGFAAVVEFAARVGYAVQCVMVLYRRVANGICTALGFRFAHNSDLKWDGVFQMTQTCNGSPTAYMV